MFISHNLACIFYFVSSEINEPDSFINHYGLKDQDFYHEYITSLYYSVVTMSTVGKINF